MSGKFNNDKHPLNIFDISEILIIFHLDISGNFNSDEHASNIFEISLT